MSDKVGNQNVGFLMMVNPNKPNGLSHLYHLDESIVIFRDITSNISFIISFFHEIHVSKQNSPRWDTAFCGVTSGAILFAYVPLVRLIWVKHSGKI